MLEYESARELKKSRILSEVSNIARVTYHGAFDGDWSMLGIAARQIYSEVHIYRRAAIIKLHMYFPWNGILKIQRNRLLARIIFT